MIAGIKEIAEAYRTLLGRDPDQDGLEAWLEAQLSPEALRQSIMLSEEYCARSARANEINLAFRMLLGREPGNDGMQTFLESKLPLDALARCIMLSPEFRGRQLALKSVALYGVEFQVLASERMYDRDYEPHVFHQLMKYMHPGVTFIDIGANIGCFSIHAAKRGARVIAVEPKPSNIGILLENARRNNVSIELHPLGASANAGYAVLQLSENANAGIQQLEATSVGDEIIATQRLDTIVGERRVDVIKIDIEGHEYSAMLGAHKLLSRCRPVIFTEYSSEFQRLSSGVDGMAYLDLLLRYGYGISILRDQGPEAVGITDVDSEWRKAPAYIDLLLEPKR